MHSFFVCAPNAFNMIEILKMHEYQSLVARWFSWALTGTHSTSAANSWLFLFYFYLRNGTRCTLCMHAAACLKYNFLISFIVKHQVHRTENRQKWKKIPLVFESSANVFHHHLFVKSFVIIFLITRGSLQFNFRIFI